MKLKFSLFVLTVFVLTVFVHAQPYNGASRLNTPPLGAEAGSVVRQAPSAVDYIGFSQATTNSIDPYWGAIVGPIGAGMTVNQTGGNLVLAAGTTARSETIIRSTKAWQDGIRLNARSQLSQRIVNNNFFVELVDVIGDGLTYNITSATALVVTIPSNPFTSASVGQNIFVGLFAGTGTFLSGRYPIASVSGNDVTFTVSAFATGTGTCSVFGHSYYQVLYTGATATNANFDTQRNGYASGATVATIHSTAAPGHIATVTGNDLIATFSDQLVASAATIQQTVRATRVENIPNDRNLRLQIRVQNGSTAPASNTTWTIGFVSISNYAATDVSINDIRPMTVATALPVEIMRGVALATQPVSGTVTANIGTGSIAAGTNAIGDVGIQYRTTSAGAGTPTILNSPATPAVQTIKGSAGRLIGFYVYNTNAAARFLKVFNVVSPTLGSTAATLDVPIPPSTVTPVYVAFEGGISFATAITVAITGARGATDNTSITLNDVTGFTIHN